MALVLTFARLIDIQKVLLIVLAGGMFFLEVRAVNSDRNDQLVENNITLKRILDNNRKGIDTLLKDNRDKTAAILRDSQDRFNGTEKSFSTVRRLSERGLGAANAALDAMNGVKSYAYAVPVASEKTVGLALRARGPNPIMGASIFLSHEKPEFGTVIPQIGAVRRGSVGTIFYQITPIKYKTGWDQYRLYIESQSSEGEINELIDIRGTPGAWQTRYRLWRMVPSKSETSPIKFVLLCYTDWWDGNKVHQPRTHVVSGPIW